ncbi:hypothetical protein C8T65DRAFT_706436 [Cerioporus squamosus]|nr:hypothetical protein C8T65DRAFT_706436 [Cerioporus squamosus]
MTWSVWRSTHTAQKVLANAKELCLAMHTQITMFCHMYNIHPNFIVNTDQSDILLFPTGKYMYQVIWSGAGAVASLPTKNTPYYQEADKLGFKYAHGDTQHWSSWETTKAWVLKILNPYLMKLKTLHPELQNNPHAKSLLLIDI